MGLTPRQVLSWIPGWQGAVVTELGGGLNNHTWRVDSNGRSAVLKIDERPRGEPFNTRHEEAQVQLLAAEAGLATRVLCVAETVYMTEYVAGEVWTTDSFDDAANTEQLAVALRKLHSLPLAGRAFDAAGAAHNYAQRIRDPDERKVRDCLQKIEAAPRPPELRLCHNDLVVENIINTPATLFLDWEYACDNDPLFDLATVVAHHGLSAAQRDVLLNAYFDGDGSRWREQLEQQEVVYESLLYLWERARKDRG